MGNSCTIRLAINMLGCHDKLTQVIKSLGTIRERARKRIWWLLLSAFMELKKVGIVLVA